MRKRALPLVPQYVDADRGPKPLRQQLAVRFAQAPQELVGFLHAKREPLLVNASRPECDPALVFTQCPSEQFG